MTPDPARTRDAWLLRLRVVTRWLTAAALAAAVAVSILAARTFPGRPASAAPAGGDSPAAQPTPSDGEREGSLGSLLPPLQAPGAGAGQAQTRSGAS